MSWKGFSLACGWGRGCLSPFRRVGAPGGHLSLGRGDLTVHQHHQPTLAFGLLGRSAGSGGDPPSRLGRSSHRATVLAPPNPHPAKEPSRGTSTHLFAFQTTAVPAVSRQKFRAWRPPHIPKPSFPSPGLLLLGTELGPGVPPCRPCPCVPTPTSTLCFSPCTILFTASLPAPSPPNTDQWSWMGGLRQPPAQHPQHPLTHPCEPGPIAAPCKTPPSSPPQALRHRLLPPEQTYTSPAGINHPLRNVGTCVREKKKVKSAWSCPALRAVEKRPPQPPSCWGSRWLRGRCHILCRILVPLGRPDAKASRVLMPSRQRGTPASWSPPRPPSWGRDAGAQSLNLRLACIFL